MFNVKQNLNNPILHPLKNNNWEEVAACNGCPIIYKGNCHVVYRAIANPDRLKAPNLFRSTIGIAEREGECSFKNRKQLIVPEKNWEAYGCEDPRITKIGNKFYIFYTALSSDQLGPDSIRVGVAITKDLKKIDDKHLVTPFNAKAMTLFPEKINGKYTAILSVDTDRPPASIAIRQVDKIEEFWDHKKWEDWYKKIDKYSIKLERHVSDLTEVGAPPLKTKDGWLLIYSHIQNYFSERERIFGIEAVLLDFEKPTKIIGRTEFPIIVPDQIYTKYGFVGDVSFPTGALLKGNELEIFYGAADTTTCTAKLDLDILLREMKKSTQKKLFKRYDKNPILKPIKSNEWENKNVFNPAAIDLDGVVRILYRAQAENGTSMIGYAESKDGKKVTYRMKKPCYEPRADFEMKKGGPNAFSGCEDPRVVLIDDNIYMTYTAYDGVSSPKIAVSHIKRDDLVNRKFKWSYPITISPAGHDDKNACILPKKFKKGYFVIHRISNNITGDYVNDLKFSPNEIDTSIEILEPRKGMWDSRKVGISSPPHLIDEGWLMLYHGVAEDFTYRVGFALLDKNDPTKILGRSTFPVFEPKEKWEKEGDVSNVVFPCGSVIRGNKFLVYYGGADRVVAVAEADLDKILKGLK